MLSEDPLLRPIAFGFLLILFAFCEAAYPRRDRTQLRLRRWIGNFGVLAAGSVLARILLTVAPFGAALWAQENSIGLFNTLSLPATAAVALTVLLLDFLIYGQHRLFHYVPVLWRLHRMHHTDMDLDVTSGLRFHPLEILLSLAVKIVAVVALGAPPLGVLIFEVLLNGTAMFNHSNLALPLKLDRLLRLLLVTPDMHRVHHSIRPHETDSNFGFNLPWWDHLFGTYLATPEDGHAAMTLGLPIFRDARSVGVINLLIQPFINDPDAQTKKGDEETPSP
jgi:sterol desaturase/sphingolipid hydroxylase (fatty acid hydroxylase superfamily)